jgi:mannose-6-phosphate isomerase-like protein (cupin superfamily)
MLVGPNSGWDFPGSAEPLLPATEFTVGVITAPPRGGAGLHTYSTVEMFMPLEGQWTIFDDHGEQVVVGTWDLAVVDGATMRGFRNTGDSDGVLLAITAESTVEKSLGMNP